MLMLFHIMATLSFTFLFLNHPVSMGITIILQALTIAMITGMMAGTFWFSYIIVLIMLSGMLVLFIYMASVASNEKFKTPTKIIIMTIIMMIVGMGLEVMYENSEEYMKIMTETNQEKMTLTMLFNSKFMYITISMVLYMFFAMVVVSFIVNIYEGPLRVKK
uniref:NADH-ubiquinone oxidoreductase chain 6 n=1 Tax=Sadoletus valdezi TaxID=2813444 RepID=A0A8T9ZXA7_9HEMI|nr:NADH dehydrogenase subunit 6 [Sadoletus valdezi]